MKFLLNLIILLLLFLMVLPIIIFMDYLKNLQFIKKHIKENENFIDKLLRRGIEW